MLFCAFVSHAIDLTVNAPSLVTVNQRFQIAYTADGSVSEFIAPSFSDFDVLMGPAKSSSMVIINNVATSHVIFTYYVRARNEGVFDVPEAGVKLKDGTVVKSRKTSIEVVRESQGGGAAPQSNQQSNPQSSGEVSPEDLFVAMEFSRTSLYKSEPAILTIKLYARNAPVTSISNLKMATMVGFDSQPLQVSQEESTLHPQKYNNKVYNVAVLGRLVLYPLRAGDLKIDPVELVASLQVKQQARSNDMFDLFMGPSFRTVSKQLKSAPATLKIKEFPAGAPHSFNGATGSFSINSAIDKTASVANQALTYSITVSGTGNFKQINEPLLVLPDKFEKYDPKISENVKAGASGGTGSKKFEYVLIPRTEGSFDLPPTEFSFFDTRKETYVTLKTKPLHLDIEKDPNASNTRPISSTPLISGKKLEHLGDDIIFIKTGPTMLKPAGSVVFGSSGFFLTGAAMLAVFALACTAKNINDKKRGNVAMMRYRKASKAASGRLKQAARLLKAGDRAGFHEEVSRAVWGYIGDKLNMQLSELSRDNVQEKLNHKNVPQENIDLLIAVIDNCEYARYAPGSSRENMKETYDRALEAIGKLENLK
jgi:hypothetical protein